MKLFLIFMSCAFLVACHHHGVKSDSACKRGKKSCWMKKADANQDGQLSRDEFHSFHKSKFDRMDANGDNTISKEEGKAAYKKWQKKRRCKGKKGKKSCPFSKKNKNKSCCKEAGGKDCQMCTKNKDGACLDCGKTGEDRKNCAKCAAKNK